MSSHQNNYFQCQLIVSIFCHKLAPGILRATNPRDLKRDNFNFVY